MTVSELMTRNPVTRSPHLKEARGGVLMDKYLPDFDVREYHEARVNAPAEEAYAVLRSLDLNRSGSCGRCLRSAPCPAGCGLPVAAPPASPPSGPFFDQVLALGWAVLEEVPGRELVAGAVTQPWAPVVRFQGLPPAELAAFSAPGFTKIVWSIAAWPVEPGVTLLSTETRVLATDEASKRKFRRYWLVFGLGIRLIRRISLRMAKRQIRKQQHDAGLGR